MKKMLCSLVALSLMTSALPAAAASGEPVTVQVPTAISLRTAVAQTAARVALQPAAVAQQPANVPAPMPRQGSSGVRHQGGGGKTGMVIGLVSTLVGVATTFVVVKQMKKATDEATKAAQQQ
jgi:hypothetical protein